MARRVRLSVDDLRQKTISYYEEQGWVVSTTFDHETEAFVAKLPRRPECVATYDGMEHLIFVSGRLTDTILSTHKQLLFDIDNSGRASHVVVICEQSVPSHRERLAKEMGLGILVIRYDGDPIRLVAAKLRGFREGTRIDNLPSRIRARVLDAIRKIRSEDVCIGVMDLVQVVETEMDRLVPATKNRPFGAKIAEAERQSKLSAQAIKAAKRINVPRIRRAHPKTHRQRRDAIVLPVQEIVDECLALLMAVA